MRILYVVQHFAGPSGAGSSRVFENARRIVAAGHEVTLLCGKLDRSRDADLEEAAAAGIAIRRAPILYSQKQSYLRRLWTFQRYMRWAVRAGKEVDRPDVVFASSTPLTVGDVGRLLAKHHRAPFVFEVRDLWPEVPISLGVLKTPVLRWLARRMARRVYAAADRIVALSPDMKRVIAGWGFPEDRIAVVPNAADNDVFGDGAVHARRGEVRRELSWGSDLVAIHPGAMGKVNGLDYLLDVAKALDARGEPGIRIVLVGDGGERPRLERRVRAESIRSAAIYPPVPKREVAAWIAAADVGVVTVAAKPFLEMNSANKFFDFLAASRPIVLNYGGWQAEVLRDSGAGRDFDPRDPSAMARGLVALRDDAEGRARMGDRARALARERYDRDRLAAQVESELRRAVEESRR